MVYIQTFWGPSLTCQSHFICALVWGLFVRVVGSVGSGLLASVLICKMLWNDPHTNPHPHPKEAMAKARAEREGLRALNGEPLSAKEAARKWPFFLCNYCPLPHFAS